MYEDVLSAFDGFLRERRLVRSSSVKHYVRRVGDFLAFAAEMRREGRRVGFEETLAVFLERVAACEERPRRQIGQAKNAVRMYYYQFRGGGRGGGRRGWWFTRQNGGGPPSPGGNARLTGTFALQKALRERIGQAGMGGDGFLRGSDESDAGFASVAALFVADGADVSGVDLAFLRLCGIAPGPWRRKELGDSPPELGWTRETTASRTSGFCTIALHTSSSATCERKLASNGWRPPSSTAPSTSPRPGKTVWTGSIWTTFKDDDGMETPVRQVFRVVERSVLADGTALLFPRLDADVWYTNLEAETEAQVIGLYCEHGTSEQYHSEFKGEIGMERLPSGKLAVNRTVMLLGMAAYNILRRIGADALNCGIRISVRKEVARRRIRKVIQDVIRIACKFVETGRSKIVRLASASPWTPVLERLYHAYT